MALPRPDGQSASQWQQYNQDLERFMQAIGTVESGNRYDAVGPQTATYGRARGRFQIMEKIYGGWAREAGVDPNDMSPAAQDKVARHKMGEYFRRYGSWDLVAVAWFAGPGRADRAKKSGISSVGGIKDVLGTSVSQYASKVMNAMSGNSSRPVNPRQADAQTPARLPNDTQAVGAQIPSNATWGEVNGGTATMTAPAPQMTAIEQATAEDQLNQNTFASIIDSISSAARTGGGGIIDAKGLFGLPEPPPPAPPVQAPEAPQPSEAATTETGQPVTPDGPLAPPPKHDGFAKLTDTAKTGSQQLMAQFPGMRFTSGYRDPARNKAAGGVKNSKHLTGQASDFVGTEEEMQQAAAWAKARGAKVLVHDSGSGRHLHVEWP